VAFWNPARLWQTSRKLTARYPIPAEQTAAVEVATAADTDAHGPARPDVSGAFILLVGLISEGIYDGVCYRQIENHLVQRESTPDTLVQHERWLEAYVSGARSGISVLAGSSVRTEAQQLAQKSRDLRERLLWSRVEAGKDDLEKADTAEDYLKMFSNGKHTEEANQICQRAVNLRQKRANQEHFDNVQKEITEQLIADVADPRRIRELEEKLDRVPYPKIETGTTQFAVRRQAARGSGQRSP